VRAKILGREKGKETIVDWSERKVLVTRGSSFIGSRLVDALVKQRADVRVVDNLSSGKTENLQHHLGGDNSLAKETIREQVKSILQRMLIER
jgi:nucleoside-diphosphate-sugar epimerase